MMRMTPQMIAALAVTVLLLAGCGESDDPSDIADPSSEPSTATSEPAPTTPAATTAPTTPSPTTAPAVGKLIDYASGEDTGITIRTPSDTSKLTGAPADFKTFIAAELATTSTEEGCTEKPQISVDVIDTGGWARGGHFIAQCGGYATLWARSNGGWKDVWGGQSLVECSTLNRYKIPARVAGDQCLEGEDAVPYSR